MTDDIVNDYERQLSELRARIVELQRQITATMRANEHLASALLEKIVRSNQADDTLADL